MMTVSEFSSKGGVPPHVVRFYSRIGLLNPARHPDNGYKLFSRSDIGRLHFIRRAQSLGYTLEEISEILDTCQRGESPCARVRDLLRQRIGENRRKLRELAALQERMERALEIWEAIPDSDPQGGSLCHLIESTESTPSNA
jgi:MerR family Zn(II)-responsive transcriptional regulator of zntA